jgi:hypothetical protein
MDKRNTLLTGILPGILLPIVLYAMLYAVFGLLEKGGAASGEGFSNNFRERTLAIVALAINVLLINMFKKRRWEAAMRGVVVATGVLAIVWLVKFGSGLFG